MKVLKRKKEEKKKRAETVNIKNEAEKITKKSGVYKTSEFQAYVIWKSLPAMLRGTNKETLDKFGISDDLSISLLEIKNQTEFAKRFRIKRATCSEWNNIIVDDNLIRDSILKWAKMITPNIVMALSKTATRTGKAPEVIAWFKIIEDWKEKNSIELNAGEDLKRAMKKLDEMVPT